MVPVATVADLLDSLDYGKTTAEQDMIEALHQHFAVPPTTDLHQALQQETSGQVLAVMLGILKPFAFMINDIYAFLSDAAVQTQGHLEVHVPLNDIDSLHLDLQRFQRFERQIISNISSTEFDPGLLPADGMWRSFHDGYWPPQCFAARHIEEQPQRCAYCPPETRSRDFAQLTHYFEMLAAIATEQRQLPSRSRLPVPDGYRWEWIATRWEESKTRTPSVDRQCMDKSEFRRHFFEQALSEFKAATRPITIADIQAFLALPYWKQRWQLYEVWFVTLVLRSYGLARLDLVLQGDQWTLSVGGVMLTPIAVSRLHNGDEIAFYYQYQGIPPRGLFPEAQDRPEILVQYRAGSEQPKRNLLVAEVKARASFSRQDMEGALYALLKWQSEAIVGLNYFDMGSRRSISEQTIGNTRIVAADACTPRSPAASDLTGWLRRLWQSQLGLEAAALLIDTSSSMEAKNVTSALSELYRRLHESVLDEILIATFNGSADVYPLSALDDGSLNLRFQGGTDLLGSIEAVSQRLQAQYPEYDDLTLHVITDLEISQYEMQVILERAANSNIVYKLYTWRSPEVTVYLERYPELQQHLEYL